MKLYIAGPMRGIQYYNFPAFDRAYEWLRLLGYDVVNPAELDRRRGFDGTQCPAGTDWTAIPEGFDLRECVRNDLEELRSCDGIYLLKGWESSTGAKAEKAVAEWLKLVVLYETLPSDTPPPPTMGLLVEAANKANAAAGEVRVVDPTTGGAKGSKTARFDLIPSEPLWQLAELYGVGAIKYAERNWQKGYKWSLSFAALMRHCWQFWSGQDRDEETKAHHLASAAFHCFALIEFGKTHPELDDRPKS